MNDTEAFILFYSNKCKHCKDFIISLQKLDTTLYNNFNKICVDNNPNIPKAIESVPTIIVPSHQYPLTDNAVFMWLETMASQYSSQSKPNGGGQTQPEPNQPSGTDSNENENSISPYVACEMGNSFSDSFSFLESEKPLEHNYTFLESNSSGSAPNDINAPNAMNSQNYTTEDLERPKMESNGNTSGFESQYETFMTSRDNDPNIEQAPQRR